MKICNVCLVSKELVDFQLRTNGKHQNTCKKCLNKQATVRISNHRRRIKEDLVSHFGAKCSDCGRYGPPFIFDFDHRDPSQKEFTISSSLRIKIADLYEEASKCDLVCATCHRMRTHKQRCNGCKYCN